MVRIPFEELCARVERVLVALGLGERAALASRLIAETDRDGVRTHGIARLPRFAKMVRLGRIDAGAAPQCNASFGALERWTGHRGPGNLAAHAAMNRAMELAREHGIGAVALADTTHWMRGGSYGWQAADAGFAALCWTNTLPNLPPWGATTAAVGNNPLVLAAPRRNAAGKSAPIVLDIAMSQFSYGTLEAYRERGELLPFPGGFDESGELTRDPAAIERTQRALPIGLWKGSGLAFVLDVLAAMLADGRATHEIPADALQEVGQSQIFIALAPSALSSREELDRIAAGAIDFLHAAAPIEPGRAARYPGEGTLRIREENLRLGVAVDDAAWNALPGLESGLGS
jgi:3-dehydro-L-gulonate 2-dehydrogenase